jgi:hypothetical protein
MFEALPLAKSAKAEVCVSSFPEIQGKDLHGIGMKGLQVLYIASLNAPVPHSPDQATIN